MPDKHTPFSPDEIALMGDDIYEKEVRTAVEAGNHGRVVAIDIETRAYALGDTVRDAAKQLLARYPDAEIWSVRIGHQALYRIEALS